MTVSFEPLRRIIDGLVHGSVSHDVLATIRHRAFISAHLAAGLAALAMLPVWLALSGVPSLAGAVAFGLLVTPLPIAAFLSRTGRYGAAHLLSAVALVGLVAWVGALTGGLASPALVWLAIVPAEAALSGSRPVTLTAAGLAVFGLLGLVSASVLGLLPAPLPSMVGLGPFLIASAIVYAGALALRIDRIHRETEAAARKGEGRYRLLAENATDLITRHGASGDVEFASPAVRAVIGCAPAEIQGQGLFERVHVADRPAYLQALSEADRTGETVVVAFRLRRADEQPTGRFVWLEMRCRPVINPANERRSVVAVIRDVTALRAQEAASQAACAAAEQANRSKDLFLANMSHELRTPLNAIIGFSDMLEQELLGKFEFQRHHDYARLIHASGEHLLEVVNGILDMSKIEAGQQEITAEAFPIGALIDSSIEMMSHQVARRGLKLVRVVGQDLPDVVADRRACRQILLNLISNAAKFTDAGGTITLSARMEQGGLVLQVSDTGIGIAPSELPRIGTPFMQAQSSRDRRHEGTGLGLSVVKGLVALHGGTFGIESELGRGTTVTVRLPARIETRPAVIMPVRLPQSVFRDRERKIA
ncbi:ATP-binding protein [Kaistia dalseonensis]|uniref:histidine kinase n=1 Tax=Kaistia dalseonensis TaxID=410840 RepID=A0ABU0HD51_9HYPH|nr:ATP-binding protein [Kaistia dalseonensis]MCX5497617.1 ATP-binding protein [Kaistia dalseonensis]MDQ0440259.1 cell cycle sensor histidine kinase DivJ [Kaistia dalseonensis]